MTFRVGHVHRMKELAAVRMTEKAVQVREHVQKEAEALKSQPKAMFHTYTEIEDFVKYFLLPARRRPVLVIIGPSQMGKSMLAEDVLMRIGKILGLEKFIEVTVQDNGSLDMSGFDVGEHGGVLLDGVGDAQMIADNRETLQGRAKVDMGGKSATMMYAFPFTLCRRAVVATMDNAANNLDYFNTHHWLSNRQNVIVLKLTSQAWV